MAETNREIARVDQLGQSQRTMLSPVAYSEAVMPALRLTRSSRRIRRISNVLLFGLACTILLMAIAPWQQTVAGTGTVIAFSPNEREQVIEAPTEGRLIALGNNIYENARVEKGEVIAEIRDLADDYIDQLTLQLLNSEREVEAAKNQLEQDRLVLDRSIEAVEFFENMLRRYEEIRLQTIGAQNAFVKSAEEKVAAEQQVVSEMEAAIPQLKADLDRHIRLEKTGDVSLLKVQELQRKYNEATAKLAKAEANVKIAMADLDGKREEREQKINKAQVDIEYAQAMVTKANGDVAKDRSTIAKTEQSIQKADKALTDIRLKLKRQQNQVIKAPFDGFLVEIMPNFETAILKKGDPICRIVPDTKDRAVQVWVDGNDAPLVEPGRHVRLQFEGWPALQFAGWPSVAVGTFGGEVISVDATDNGKGKFRILIRPYTGERSPEWPNDRFLKQGMRANGWVLLNQVPLWFEVWRRLNGFPPVVDVESQKIPKTPKLPK
jgi:multidrug resistance efflux pump